MQVFWVFLSYRRKIKKATETYLFELTLMEWTPCEKLPTFFLFQSISMAIQRGNAVCVMGCPKNRSAGLEGLFNFQVHEAEVL